MSYIIHIITGLNDGGAEATLYRLCKTDHSNRHLVISLSGTGKYVELLKNANVSVQTLNMSAGRLPLLSFVRLISLLRYENPDLVQTWMIHGNFLGGIAARIAGIRSVVWGIRHTTLETGKVKKITIWISKLLALMSWWIPAQIVACAKSAIDAHEALGYDRKKMVYIPNGYDFREFAPLLDLKEKLKLKLGLPLSIPLIGMVGRFDAQKDHQNLLDALCIVRDRNFKFCCVLVGSNIDSLNLRIIELIAERGLSDHVKLLGKRNDIPYVMNSLDLHVLSSAYGEAFPNVVAEAMACGTPCVVTDVGDASSLVGDTGWVVPARDFGLLAEAIINAIIEMNTKGWQAKCICASTRIKENFSIIRMVAGYNQIWSAVQKKNNFNL